MMVVTTVSRRVGHTTFATSARTCWRNVNGFVLAATAFSSQPVVMNHNRIKRISNSITGATNGKTAHHTLSLPYLWQEGIKCKCGFGKFISLALQLRNHHSGIVPASILNRDSHL